MGVIWNNNLLWTPPITKKLKTCWTMLIPYRHRLLQGNDGQALRNQRRCQISSASKLYVVFVHTKYILWPQTPIGDAGIWEGLSYTRLVVFLTSSDIEMIIHLLTFTQIIVVENVLCAVNTPTHTMYVLDDVLGRPVYVWLWKIGEDVLPEEHEIRYGMQTCLVHHRHWRT